MKIGAHMSIAGGVENCVYNGDDVGCEVVQLFTKSNRRWAAKELGEEDQTAFMEAQDETAVEASMVHMAYLVNLASPKEEQFEKSFDAFVKEIRRAEFCFHPGSHTGQGEENAIEQVADAVRDGIEASETENVRVLIEGMAGQGTSIGYTFEQLREILARIDRPDRTGVCLDTAHLHAAGYDLQGDGYEETIQSFDEIVGLEKLYGWHINDTEEELGSNVDRHHHIGKGNLGKEPFRKLVNDDRFEHLPGLLETPKENNWDEKNITLLTSLRENES